MSVAANVTVLFTDLVDSTELHSSVGPAEADNLRRDHFTQLRQAIADTGGHEVKNLGDGLMVVFDTASAAIECAVRMQQNVDLGQQAISSGIRIGISGGEVTLDDDDYFGDPVVEAARLCASCTAGQILSSHIVVLMAGRRNPHESTMIGPLSLKGLPEPTVTVEILWTPIVVTTAGIGGLPALLDERGSFPCAGRQSEGMVLSDAYAQVATG
ncbi:MAG TPA: adenylate/guanylate cyclase domain-containing protein, partial [Ilumatobacteraceae bacterium]|nr:adenylate/guanylate cyclase domain-containing protein [Ilumatobacteraceae bacterium]